MLRSFLRSVSVAVLVSFVFVSFASAQESGGSIVGYITDPDGVPIPGTTATAEGDVMIGTRVAYSDVTGRYRLVNLPPGEYTLTYSLAGFKTIVREGIQARAGNTFRIDVSMELGGIEETVTVSGDTPMIDIANPGQVFNIDGEFQRAVPVQGRKNWTDFLEMTPGVNARPFDDGSGRMVYFGHATEHFAHVIQVEGQSAVGYRDSQPTYLQMSTDMIADVEVKSGGVDASSPMGTGLQINIVTKSGGNDFHGSLANNLQPMSWNGDNTPAGGQASPTVHKNNQVDFSLGGPIRRDKIWFFTSGRWASNEAGIGRTERDVEFLKQYNPNFEPFNNIYSGFFPYAKITASLNNTHMLSGYYQYDILDASGDREHHAERFNYRNTGGSLIGAKLTSIYSGNLSSEIILSYNNRTSSYSSLEALAGYGLTGPQIQVHEDTYLSSGLITGTGVLVLAGNRTTATIGPSTFYQAKADINYFVDDMRGSHEFKTGLFFARGTRHDTTNYMNDGFTMEHRVWIDPDNPSAGTIPFFRESYSPTVLKRVDNVDRDIAIYLQDSWNPIPNLTLSFGVRADFVNRHDNIFDFDRMNDVAIGPRLGFAYAVTDDGTTIIRGSLNRVHEQMNGRDYSTNVSVGGNVSRTRLYDNNLDGVFETSRFRAEGSAALEADRIAADLHQPYTDEAIIGIRKQFAGDVALDVAFIGRSVKHRYADYDINGYWPDGPNQPFGGWGKIDPDEGRINQLRNNTWDTLEYRAIEITIAKRLSNNWQFLAGINRQFQHLKGTWNPTDPAGYIQPDAYENSKCIWMPRGRRDDNSYGGGSTSTYCPTWRNYSLRFGGTYFGPFGIVATGSFSIQAGPWSGNIMTRLDDPDPVFGPSTVVSSTGNSESNPLATVVRFKYPTRDEGQVKASDAMFLNVKLGKEFEIFSAGRRLEIAAEIFNPFNWGDFQQYNYRGANQEWNPNFLEGRSRQSAAAVQLSTRFTF